MAAEIRELDGLVRKNLTDIEGVTCANFLDDLAQFSSEPNITREMLKIYVPIRFDVLESNGWDRPGGYPESFREQGR